MHHNRTSTSRKPPVVTNWLNLQQRNKIYPFQIWKKVCLITFQNYIYFLFVPIKWRDASVSKIEQCRAKPSRKINSVLFSIYTTWSYCFKQLKLKQKNSRRGIFFLFSLLLCFVPYCLTMRDFPRILVSQRSSGINHKWHTTFWFNPLADITHANFLSAAFFFFFFRVREGYLNDLANSNYCGIQL